MLSMINIGLLTYKNEEFGLKQSFEDFLKKHYEGNMKKFLNVRKDLSKVQRTQVLLGG